MTLVASTSQPDGLASAAHPLRQLCRTIVSVPDVKDGSPGFYLRVLAQVLARNKPPPIAYNYSAAIQDAVVQNLHSESYDVVHLNHIDAAQYVDTVSPDRCVVDTHNLLFDFHQKAALQVSNPVRRMLHRFASLQLRQFERRALGRCHRVLVCSRREKECLDTLGLGERVHVIPNGVDCEYFRTDADFWGNPPSLLFIGHMAYGANNDAAAYFIREVLPLLRQEHTGIRFLVVGKQPRPDLVALAAGRGDITVTGGVDDVRPYLRSARVFVAPIRFGAGTRLKLLEAFGTGIPVVSTHLGAEGIECVDGEHLLLADRPEDLARQISRLFTDRALYMRLSQASRELVRREYDWKAIGPRLLDVYQRLWDPSHDTIG